MKRFRRIHYFSAPILVIASVSGCSLLGHRVPYAPERPAWVPSDAVYIQGPDGHGFWDWCRLNKTEVTCSILTAKGNVIREGKFIPYRGSGPHDWADLHITQKSGDGWISLANGSYLIPEKDNEGSKRYLNFMTGSAKSFAN